MPSLSEIAREEAGHAIAAFWAGHQIEHVRIGFGPRTAYVRLAAREPTSVAEAVESAAIRLIGPEMAPGAASFPPYCGPVDDATAAMAILDRVAGSVKEADALLEHARGIARATVRTSAFEPLVDQLVRHLIRAGGQMPGEQVEAVLTELQGSAPPPGELNAPLAGSGAASTASGEASKDFGSGTASDPKRGAIPLVTPRVSPSRPLVLLTCGEGPGPGA